MSELAPSGGRPNRLFLVLAIGLGGLLVLGLIGLGGFFLLQGQSPAAASPTRVALAPTRAPVAPTATLAPAAAATLAPPTNTPAPATSTTTNTPAAPATSTQTSVSAPATSTPIPPTAVPPTAVPPTAVPPTAAPVTFGLDRHGCPDQADHFMNQPEFTKDLPTGLVTSPEGTNVGFIWGDKLKFSGQDFGRKAIVLTTSGTLTDVSGAYRIRWHVLSKSTLAEYKAWAKCFVEKDEGVTYEWVTFAP